MINRIFLSKCIAIFHILVVMLPMILRILYINVNKYDVYLLLYIFLMRFHWYLCKGECIISYFEKKIALPNYKLGYDIYCTPTRELIGTNKINLKNHSNVMSNFFGHIFTLFILFYNINSKQFNLLLIIALASTILTIYANIEENNYIYKRRKILKKKLKQNLITKDKALITDLVIY